MKAIKKVFPNSTNYMCSWHLQQNLKKRFVYLNRGNDLDKKALYRSIINLPYQNYQKEFEDSYEEISISNHINKELKTYLKNKCSDKKLWVKAFMKGKFCAGMCTTSRIESKH